MTGPLGQRRRAVIRGHHQDQLPPQAVIAEIIAVRARQIADHVLHRPLFLDRRLYLRLDLDVELVNLRQWVRGPTSTLALPPIATAPAAGPTGHYRVAGLDDMAPMYRREDLVAGQVIAGPALVCETVATTWLAAGWEWLPLGGYKPDNIDELGTLDAIMGRIRHMIIPVTGYMVGGFATMTILMKNSLLENLGADYVRTAFAKGLSERRVIFLHALRNSLIPITASIGHALGLLFAGSFLIEKTCNIHGMGMLGYQSILARDYPVIQGTILIFGLLYIMVNLIVDLIYALVDPRIRLS